MKIVALIGEPGSGKSAIARSLIEKLPSGIPFKNGLTVGTYYPSIQLYVLGSYPPGEKFPGTDRLSMAAQPSVEEFFRIVAWKCQGAKFFFEGDRLGNVSFLNFCSKVFELKLFVTSLPDEALARNRAARSNSQSETFLKSRRTKVGNVLAAFPEHSRLPNVTPEDVDRCARVLLNELS